MGKGAPKLLGSIASCSYMWSQFLHQTLEEKKVHWGKGPGPKEESLKETAVFSAQGRGLARLVFAWSFRQKASPDNWGSPPPILEALALTSRVDLAHGSPLQTLRVGGEPDSTICVLRSSGLLRLNGSLRSLLCCPSYWAVSHHTLVSSVVFSPPWVSSF